MATLREFQFALQEKLELLRQRDELIADMRAEMLVKDDQIQSMKAELGKYRALVLNNASLRYPAVAHSPLIYSQSNCDNCSSPPPPPLEKRPHSSVGPNLSVPSRRSTFVANTYSKVFEIANQHPQQAYTVNSSFAPTTVTSACNTVTANGVREKRPAVSAEPTTYQTVSVKLNPSSKNEK